MNITKFISIDEAFEEIRNGNDCKIPIQFLHIWNLFGTSIRVKVFEITENEDGKLVSIKTTFC